MTGELIVGLVAFLVSMIAIMSPIIKLNSNIVKLNTTMQDFEETYKENHKKLENRVSYHGKEIDELEKTTVQHEVRITNLEDKVK